MSTILKALRRLEEERAKQSETERLHGEVVAPASGRSGRARPAWLVPTLAGVALLLIAVGGAGLWLRGPAMPDVQVEGDPSATSVVTAQPDDPELAAAAPAPASTSPEALTPAQASAEARRAAAIALREKRAEQRRLHRETELQAPRAAPRAATLAVADGTSAELAADGSEHVAALERGTTASTGAAAGVEPASQPLATAQSSRRVTPRERAVQEVAPEPAGWGSDSQASRSVEADAPPPSEQAKAPSTTTPPQRDAQVDPAASVPTPKSASASPTRTSPSVEIVTLANIDVSIVRTVWHPRPERRVAHVAAPGGGEVVELHEGDEYVGLRVSEIKLSGVVFERNGVLISRRVGEGR